MDFLHFSPANGSKFHALSIEGAPMRGRLVIEASTSLPAQRIVRVWEQLRVRRHPSGSSLNTAPCSRRRCWIVGLAKAK